MSFSLSNSKENKKEKSLRQMLSKKSRVHISRRLLQKQKIYQYEKKTNLICET